MTIPRFFSKLLNSIRKRVPFLRPRAKSGPALDLDQLLGDRPSGGKEVPKMLDLEALFRAHGIRPRGVIHLGAHLAEELGEYLRLGFGKILYVEANPALIPALQAKAAAHPGRVFVVHAAVSDTDGTVNLRLTTMDQSSSILPLGKHLDIYPSIREVRQVEVPCRRLDTLLREAGLDPADFNFLNIDIQGAELLALRGAEGLLPLVDAVNSEVSLEELYRGSALLGELEGHLHRAGFNRAAMATPWHPTWGDAFYVRKPVVTMTTLGTNGRFANQLLQYLFLRLVAKKQGAVVQTPVWAGQALFGFAEPAPVLPLPVWREPVEQLSATDSFRGCEWTRFFREKDPAFKSVDYWGYFMGHSADLAPEKDFIREVFRFAPRFEAVASKHLAQLRTRRPRVLAVHLRRGDYGYGYFFRTPCRWYEEWLRTSGLDPAEWIVYVCSETPGPYRGRFAGYEVADAGDFQASPALAGYLDFYMMTQADYVLSANSTYSFLASMLNTRARGFARPCSAQEALIPYDPWDAPVLLRREPSKADHERFSRDD